MRASAAIRARPGRAGLAGLLGSLVLAVLVAAAAFAFGPTYGGWRWLIAAAGGATVGALIVWAGSQLRLHWSMTVPALAVAYLVFGAALATPDSAVRGVLPSLESVRLLALGVVTSWRQVLTVQVPVGSSGALLVPVYLSALLLTAIGTAVAMRTSRPLWSLLAPAGMFVVSGLFGTHTGFFTLTSAGVVAIGGLLWASAVHARGGRAGLDLRRPLSAVLVLAAAVAALMYASGPAAPSSDRLALRDSVTPPFDPQQYPSPLSGFRNFVRDDVAKKTALFSVTGLPDDVNIRLAALDQYDGVAFSVTTNTGTFARVGDQVSGGGAGTQMSARITLDHYSGVYLPDIGELTAIRFSGDRRATLTENFRYAAAGAVGVVNSGVQQGDSYQLEAVLPELPAADSLATAVPDSSTGLVAPQKIPDAAQTVAGNYADSVDGSYAKAMAMLKGIKAAGHLSHGTKTEDPSPSGHGLDRLSRLLKDPQMVGDQEQFAPALSMMLWSQGIPNRVVMGFAVGKHGRAAVTVTGADVTAWVEVPFVGYGWIAFDPTPDRTSKAPQPVTKSQAAPNPQVVQPPPPPPAAGNAKSTDQDQSDATDKPNQDKKKDQQNVAGGSGPWLGIGLGGGGLLVLIAAGIGLILLLKARRRNRRERDPSGPARIAGGWDQILDAAVDLGHPLVRNGTRTETAADLDDRFGTGTLLLARQADAGVFGPEEVDPAEAGRFWAEVDDALLGLRSGEGWFGRLRARLSIASLRRAGRGS